MGMGIADSLRKEEEKKTAVIKAKARRDAPPIPPAAELVKQAHLQNGTRNGRQDGFPFFKLPPELRNKICDLVLSTSMQAVQYRRRPSGLGEFSRYYIHPILGVTSVATRIYSYDKDIVHIKRLPLLQTCKQLYLEALRFMYHGIFFQIRSITQLESLLKRLGPNGRMMVQLLTQIHIEGASRRVTKLSPLINECTSLKRVNIIMTPEQY